jgi:hypothetical protein
MPSARREGYALGRKSEASLALILVPRFGKVGLPINEFESLDDILVRRVHAATRMG